MARIYYKTYYRCNTENQDIHDAFPQDVNMHYSNYTFNGLLHTDGSYTTTMPSWFTQVDGWPLTDTGWSIDTPNESGTHYKFSWTAHKPGGNDEYIVELIMLDYCAVEVHNTNCNARVLTWLTREGGWAYFTFSGKSTFEVKIPQGKTFQNSDYVLRYNSRPDVYTGEQLSTGSIPEGTLELLESLKYSVQVYLIQDYNTTPRYVPVVIQDGDFTKRKTGDKRFDVTVKFVYAEQVQIQTQ